MSLSVKKKTLKGYTCDDWMKDFRWFSHGNDFDCPSNLNAIAEITTRKKAWSSKVVKVKITVEEI